MKVSKWGPTSLAWTIRRLHKVTIRRQVVVGVGVRIKWGRKDQVHAAVASRAHGIGVLLKKWRTSETIVKFQAFCSDTELSRLDLSAETSGMRGRERVRENDKYSIFYWEYISDHTSAQQKNILWPTIIPMIHMNRNMNVRIKWECSEILYSLIVLFRCEFTGRD